MEQALVVQEVPFNEQAVLMGQEKDGEILVPIKRLCENLGIDHKNQAKKIKADLRFNWGDMTIVAPDGKKRKMTCLPINQLSGWLFSINSAKVKPLVRDKLVLYQRECVKVLDSYWRKGAEARIKELEQSLKHAHITWELIDMQGRVEELTAELEKSRKAIKTLPAPTPLPYELKDDDEVRVNWKDLRELVDHGRVSRYPNNTAFLVAALASQDTPDDPDSRQVIAGVQALLKILKRPR